MHHTLRTHLTLLFIGIALAPLLLFAAGQFEKIGAAADESKARQRQATLRLSEEIATYVKNHRQVVEAFAGEIAASEHRDPQRLRPALESIVRHFPGFLNVYAADAAGRNRAFYTPDPAAASPPPGYDFSSRNYYPAIAAQQKTIVSPLFRGTVTTDRPMVIIAAPLFDRAGAFDGYLSAALDLSEVANLAQKYAGRGPGYAAVLDGDGKAICSTDERAQDAAQNPPDALAGRLRELRDGAETLADGPDGAPAYLTFTTLPETGWLVFLSRPSAAYRAELVRFSAEALALVLFALAGCAALSWFLAGYLNRPIRSFMRYTRQLGRGNFAGVLPAQRYRNLPRELNVLAAHFFAMARRLEEKQTALQRLTAALEDKVAERTDNLQAVLESMSDAVAMADDRRRIVYANRRLGAFASLPPERLKALDEAALCEALAARAPADAARIEDVFAEAETAAALRCTGGRRLALQTFSVASARCGKRLGRGFLLRDVTERYEIEQVKNNLISLAAHEFKTPLTGIRGGVETLLRPDVVWDETFRRELLGDVLEDVLRIQKMVEDWLDISKLDARTLRLHRREFPLGELVARLERRMRRQKLAFSLTTVLDPPALTLCADPDRLEQVLSNLFENAVLYSDGPAALRLEARMEGQLCRLRVEDRGVGIAPQDLPHIFERFYRADLSSTRRRGGTGLGLAVCKGVVEMHGGSIAVESVLGEGSAFTILLPCEKEEEATE